ncbi:DUF2232 domain-containing protein [Paradesulfitobacterium aromaticivorans]
MYISDEKVIDYLGLVLLLFLPLLGIALNLWGWFLEILIMLAVFVAIRRHGPGRAMLFLGAGYVLPLIIHGLSASAHMSFVPWAAMLAGLGLQKLWPQRVVYFWSLVLAGVLGSLPFVTIALQSLEAQSIKDFTNYALEFYRSSGMLSAIQQQGVDEYQLRLFLEQYLPFYVMLTPAFTALASMLEFGVVAYFARRWFYKNEGMVPFARWRLPWYAIWGAILALASYLLGDELAWHALRGVGLNLMVVYVALAMVIGISVYLYFLQSPQVPRFLKWMLILVNLFYFFFSFVSIIMFGLFDMVLNFRKLPESKG